MNKSAVIRGIHRARRSPKEIDAVLESFFKSVHEECRKNCDPKKLGILLDYDTGYLDREPVEILRFNWREGAGLTFPDYQGLIQQVPFTEPILRPAIETSKEIMKSLHSMMNWSRTRKIKIVPKGGEEAEIVVRVMFRITSKPEEPGMVVDQENVMERAVLAAKTAIENTNVLTLEYGPKFKFFLEILGRGNYTSKTYPAKIMAINPRRGDLMLELTPTHRRIAIHPISIMQEDDKTLAMMISHELTHSFDPELRRDKYNATGMAADMNNARTEGVAMFIDILHAGRDIERYIKVHEETLKAKELKGDYHDKGAIMMLQLFIMAVYSKHGQVIEFKEETLVPALKTYEGEGVELYKEVKKLDVDRFYLFYKRRFDECAAVTANFANYYELFKIDKYLDFMRRIRSGEGPKRRWYSGVVDFLRDIKWWFQDHFF
jgi:hypothetical protein